jgi:hypothetical protein
MDQYPRMLYRPGNGPSEIWNELVDTSTVCSADEERTAVLAGWLPDPGVACAKANKRRLRKAKWQAFAKNWQFLVTTALALAAVVVGALALK